MEANLISQSKPSNFSFRPLLKSDQPAICSIFLECFPLSYPDSLYTEIVSGKYYSLAALDGEVMVGMIIAEIRKHSRLESVDSGFLSNSHYYNDTLYILNLCVTTAYRGKGIATSLMQKLYTDFNTCKYSKCKAIYLHVLTNNNPAIAFYHKFNFIRYTRIPDFYVVNNKLQDCYLYVLYIHDGRAPDPNEKSCFKNLVFKNVIGCIVLVICSLSLVYFIQRLLTSHVT